MGRLVPRLIGFLNPVEREFFQMFCEVDGVGVKKALRAMVRPVQEVAVLIERVDLLAGPTTPTLPFRLGEKTADPLEMYLSDVYTVTANLAGIPGLSMPCAFSDEGLPIGLQLLGPHFQEGRLLRAAHALEGELDLQHPAQEV